MHNTSVKRLIRTPTCNAYQSRPPRNQTGDLSADKSMEPCPGPPYGRMSKGRATIWSGAAFNGRHTGLQRVSSPSAVGPQLETILRRRTAALITDPQIRAYMEHCVWSGVGGGGGGGTGLYVSLKDHMCHPPSLNTPLPTRLWEPRIVIFLAQGE